MVLRALGRGPVPTKLPAAQRLRRYVEEFDTVELNASFYRWPKDSTFRKWRAELPDGFAMSVKAHRGLTHYRRLKNPSRGSSGSNAAGNCSMTAVARCWSSCIPSWPVTTAASTSSWPLCPGHVRIAMELRHPSWDDPAVYALLEKHHAAYVVTSGAGMRCVPRATSDLVYVRMHGPASEELYTGSYSNDDLQSWAERIVKVGQRKSRRVAVLQQRPARQRRAERPRSARHVAVTCHGYWQFDRMERSWLTREHSSSSAAGSAEPRRPKRCGRKASMAKSC